MLKKLGELLGKGLLQLVKGSAAGVSYVTAHPELVSIAKQVVDAVSKK